MGHIRPYCQSVGPDLRLDPPGVRRRNADNSSRGGGGQRGRGNQNGRPSNNRGGWNNGTRQDAANGQAGTVPSRRVAPVPVEWRDRLQVDSEVAIEPLPQISHTSVCNIDQVVESQAAPVSNMSSYPIPEVLLAIGLPDNGLGKGDEKGEASESHPGNSGEFLASCSGPIECTLARPRDPVEEETDGTDGDNTPAEKGGILLRSSEVRATTDGNLTETRGWLAPVHVNGVLMMLAVDTGAAMTIINS
jgi:hypothetical protein